MPLAVDLARDHDVRGSYRREEVAAALRAGGVTPCPLDLPVTDHATVGDFLEDAQSLVITLPPGGRTHGEAATDRYLELLEALRPHLRPELHVVYTSSTGVYGKAVEGTITEESPLRPDTASSRAVVAAERWLGEHADQLAVLRLGGLYGPGRDPSRFFVRREAIPDADAPVNMLSLHDAVAALRFVVHQRVTGIFNLCASAHLTRRAFYGMSYRAAGLPPKPFLPGGAGGKRVDPSKFNRLGGPSL